MTDDSRIPGFYRMSVGERIATLESRKLISPAEASALRTGQPLLAIGDADRMIENVIGTFGLPFAIAPNFLIDGVDRLVPMVAEEPSIVAGLSGVAKIAREAGGFRTEAADSLLSGQIQVTDVADPEQTMRVLDDNRAALLDHANRSIPRQVARGGGCRDIEVRKRRLPDDRWTVVVNVMVDTRDAMGANMVNGVCEALAPAVEKLTGGSVLLRILSNLADRSLVTARVTIRSGSLGSERFDGESIRDGVVLATAFADVDPHRAATHNKGIMNGIDAVAIATGNDWRAIEAGAHAYAARDGHYRSLSKWSTDDAGNLVGELTMPLKVGILGGSLEANPGARLGLSIAGPASAAELAATMCCVGLAQNLAALRALVSDGIQHGHMRLHARSVAAAAGVPEEQFDGVVEQLIESGEIKTWKAKEISGNRPSPAAEPSGVPADASAGSAAGKTILLGEHAVVYGRHALALPLRNAVTAYVRNTGDDLQLTVRERGEMRSYDLRDQTVGGMAGAIDLILKRMDIDERRLSVYIDSRIPSAMGLGSSAAYAVAIIRALAAHFSVELSDSEVNALAFDCEKLAHGTPSGIDNNLATYAEPILFSQSTRTRRIELPEMPPLILAASGIRGITKEQVAGVRRRYEQSSKLYETIFDEIDDLSVAGAVALRNNDYDTLGAMMNVCHGLLNALQVSMPELESMVHVARSNGAVGAKLTGAGGGGSIVALCPGCEDKVAAALRAAGSQVIRLRIP